MEIKEARELLEKNNIRIFGIDLDNEETFWLHTDKTVNQWRYDIEAFKNRSFRTDYDGFSDSELISNLHNYLFDLGYIEVYDLVSEIYNCRVAKINSQLVDKDSSCF